MAYVADLHIHSRFSRACSPQLNVPNLVEWAKYKGINLLGTGDFLHPLWLNELKANLTEDGSGFLTYSKDPAVKFLLSVEIASIYSQGGKGRRIHNLVFLPDFASAEKFQKALFAKHATLASDGRPIVGIPSKELLRMALEATDKALFIPAHAWTPWFGIFGSESGYDSLSECFEDMTDYIYGIETGLSSDPEMNWRVKELDSRSIVSFSDAHSLPNLGREATVLGGDISEGYEGLRKAIKQPYVIASEAKQSQKEIATSSTTKVGTPRNDRVIGTIEFYPEEGKYHYTGHRACGVKYTPADTSSYGTICPKCGRGLTVGVMERVEELAGRANEELKVKNEEGVIKSEEFPEKAAFRKLVPLHQIIAEAFGNAPTSQKVLIEYKKLASTLGGEIKILTKVGIDDIAKISGPKIAEGVLKVRKGELVIDPGYDGVYGVVKIWAEGKAGSEGVEGKEENAPQLGLFDLHD